MEALMMLFDLKEMAKQVCPACNGKAHGTNSCETHQKFSNFQQGNYWRSKIVAQARRKR